MERAKGIMAKIPIIFLLVGAVICGFLTIKSFAVSSGAFDYFRYVRQAQIYQAIIFICAECGVAAVWFEYLRIKTDKGE